MSTMPRFAASARAALYAILAVALLLAVACGAAEKPAPTTAPAAAKAPAVAAPVPKATPAPTPIPVAAAKVHPGKLTIMMGELANERFDVTFAGGAPGAHSYGRIVHGFLISDNERRDLVPGIATRWDLSADGLTWTFTIRKGVKWHDGSELTPQDVLWALQHTLGPQAFEYSAHGKAVTISRAMDRIELSGPDKVSMTTKKPDSTLAVLVSEASPDWFPIMPKRAKLRDTQEEVAYDNNPIGAGFMRLAKHVPASVMKFERFDDFYYQPKNGFPEDKRVNFQSLDLFLAPEEATRVAAVRAGEADIVPASLTTKKQVEAGGGRVVFGLEGVVVDIRWLGCFDPQLKPPCRDKRVRQALDYAIDKELIRDRLYGGPAVFQVKAWGLFTPSTIGYTPALDPWPFDPAKARQLLADAGYPGGKGFGKLIVNTFHSTSMPLQVEAAQLAADLWRRELGLDVAVNVGDATGTRTRWRAGELNGQILWWDQEARKPVTLAGSYGDPKSATRLHDDPELFRLVQETLEILDPDQRAKDLNKLLLRLRDESYQLGIGYINIPWAVGPRVLTWQPYPLSLHPSALHTITLK